MLRSYTKYNDGSMNRIVTKMFWKSILCIKLICAIKYELISEVHVHNLLTIKIITARD